MFGLFVTQFVLGAVLPEDLRAWERIGVGIMYLVLGAYILVRDRRRIPVLVRDGLRTPAEDGKFAVMTRGRAATVRYEAGSRKDETIKSALVVDLDSSPESVYVEISTAR